LSSDPLPVLWSLSLILLLVFLNGFFVATEFAIIKARNSRIDLLVQEGSRNAKFAQTIMSNINGYLSACQMGITLASLALGWIGEPTS
jgi:CBS domain containing-hemolysin-like protein